MSGWKAPAPFWFWWETMMGFFAQSAEYVGTI
jgi:hypothetical protein